MKFTLAQIAGAASRGGLDGDDVMHDLLQLAERNGNTPTLREYFIASAPEHPQPWFKPAMPPRPEGLWQSLDGRRTYTSSTAAERECGFDGYQNTKADEQRKWDEEKLKQAWIQWPSAWADEQLRLLAARLIG